MLSYCPRYKAGMKATVLTLWDSIIAVSLGRSRVHARDAERWAALSCCRLRAGSRVKGGSSGSGCAGVELPPLDPCRLHGFPGHPVALAGP